MKRETADQKFIRQQVESLLGKPQAVKDLNGYGRNTRVYVWSVTTKGGRAMDRSLVLVASDKARDLGATIYYLKNVRYLGWSHTYAADATTMDDCTGIAVWVDGPEPSVEDVSASEPEPDEFPFDLP